MQEQYLLVLILGIQCLLSGLIVFVLSILNKRQSFQVECCYGRPSLVVPVNLLDSYDNRYGYAMSFGALTLFLVNTATTESGNTVYLLAIISILYGWIAYPLFACQSTKSKLFGNITGFLYCIFWLGRSLFVNVFPTLSDSATPASLKVLAMAICIPEFACISILLCKFGLVWRNSWNVSDKMVTDAEKHSLSYTRQLMKKTEEISAFSEPGNINYVSLSFVKGSVLSKIYRWKPEFKYSARIVCAFFVCFLTAYILFIILLIIPVRWEILVPKLSNKSLRIYRGILYATAVITFVRSCLLLLNMMHCYRKHIMKLRRGDREWLPDSLKRHHPPGTRLMMQSMKYAGSQIGYTIWGFSLSFLVLFFLLCSVCFLFFENWYSLLVFRFLKSLWPTLLTVVLLYVFQLLASKYIFLQEKGKVLALNNRSTYHIVCYFMFFYNIFFGFFAGMLRSFLAFLLGASFMERVQRSILPRSFENFDPGYNAYLGYLLMEHAHANPVMQAFVIIMLNQSSVDLARDRTKFANIPDHVNEMDRKEIRRWKTARNHWQLCLTLIRNPSLRKYRKNKALLSH